MPNFLTGYFWDVSSAELWVGAGTVIFLLIVWLAGGFKAAGAALDGKAAKIQSELDEAARLRAEAEALLAQIRQEKAEAEAQAADMLTAAEADAKRMEAEARQRLEDSLARREQMAERKIAQAEAQAAADVKAAAVEAAAAAAERILAERLAASTTDPMADQAIGQIGSRLN